MAKKKLNKKVAIIGSIIFIILAMAVIYVVLRMSQGPEKFLSDARAAAAAGDYETAQRNYARAQSRAKSNDLKKEILFELGELQVKYNEWEKALACWQKITTIDPANIQSRTKRLDYFYAVADNGHGGAWKEVLNASDELLSLHTTPKLRFMKGRATFELAKRGETTDREASLTEAIRILEETRKSDPNNAEIYWYLAQASIERGDVLTQKGSLDEKDKAFKKAESLLEKAVAIAPNDPNVHIRLLDIKLNKFRIAKASDQIKALEPEYIALTKKFPNKAAVFGMLSFYYSLDPNGADKSFDAAQKAFELEPQSVRYALSVAQFYRRAAGLKSDPNQLDKAIEIAKQALNFPDAQDIKGPRKWVNRTYKLSINTFLANAYAEQIMDLPPNAPKDKKDKILKDAGDAVHEMTQIWGTAEHPYVAVANGMLAMAKGQSAQAVKMMYAAYEQLKPLDPLGDPNTPHDVQLGFLSYVLAQNLKNSAEIGAVQEFLFNAIMRKIYLEKPAVLLDYAAVAINLRQFNAALDSISAYEKLVGATTASTILKAQANIGANQFDEAQSILDKAKGDETMLLGVKMMLLKAKLGKMAAPMKEEKADAENADALKSEIEKNHLEQLATAKKLLQREPNSPLAFMAIYDNAIALNKKDEIKKAISYVLSKSPDNPTALFYKYVIAEPDPNNISKERRTEIMIAAASEMQDPAIKSNNLAEAYRAAGQYDKAIAEYKKILEKDPANKAVVFALFDTAIQAEDYDLAEQMAAIGRRENIDDCQGQFISARLAIAKKDYKDALSKIEIAIKERPVFAFAYVLRSSINSELGNEQLAIDDAKKAMYFNPLDATAAKNLAYLLYQRNVKLGNKVTREQQNETREALGRAWRINPQEWQLLSFYAEYISDFSANEALAIRQSLLAAVPTIENAVLLGNLATRMALEERNVAEKKEKFEIARAAYEQGLKIDPNNVQVLNGFGEYLRITGQQEKAAELLAKSENKNLLWWHYLKTGEVEEAQKILEQQYKENSKDPNILSGLLLVTQNTGNAVSVKKYAQELVAAYNTNRNQILQISSYIEVGLIPEAENLLAAYIEKNPNDAQATLLQAQVHVRKGNFDDAIKVLNKALELNTNDADAWKFRGHVLFALGRFEEAVSDFQKSRTIRSDARIRVDLARAYIRLGRTNDAINELTLAVQEEPGIEIYQMLEDLYIKSGRKEMVTNFHAEMMRKYPTSIFWYNRAAAFALADKNAGKAAELYRKAWQMTQDPKIMSGTQPETVYRLGRSSLDGYLRAMLAEGQYSQLITFAAQFIDGKYASVAYARMADAKSKLADNKAAVDFYRKAIDKAAEDEGFVFEIISRMSSALGREQTIQWCTEQIKNEPDSLPVNMAMCNLMRQGSDYNKALSYNEKCLKIAGSNETMRRSFLDTRQAILVEAFEKTSDKRYFLDALKIYEDWIANSKQVESGVLNNLAYLLAKYGDAGQIEKAVEYAKQAYIAAPTNTSILDTYAFSLYQKGDYKKASEYIQIAVQMFEKTSISAPADVYWHLGMINEKIGRLNEAKNAYKHALEVGGENMKQKDKDAIAEAIKRLK